MDGVIRLEQFPTMDRVYTRWSQRAPGLARLGSAHRRFGVDVWTGVDDTLVDSRRPPELPRRIPSTRLHVCSGGHFMAHLRDGEIFEALRDA